MAKTTHPHVEAARMAAQDFNDLLDFIKKSDYGRYPDSGQDSRTIARNDRIDNLPPHLQELKDQGFPREFLDRLAKLAED